MNRGNRLNTAANEIVRELCGPPSSRRVDICKKLLKATIDRVLDDAGNRIWRLGEDMPSTPEDFRDSACAAVESVKEDWK